jgi:hypothetical protein
MRDDRIKKQHIFEAEFVALNIDKSSNVWSSKLPMQEWRR